MSQKSLYLAAHFDNLEMFTGTHSCWTSQFLNSTDSWVLVLVAENYMALSCMIIVIIIRFSYRQSPLDSLKESRPQGGRIYAGK